MYTNSSEPPDEPIAEAGDEQGKKQH